MMLSQLSRDRARRDAGIAVAIIALVALIAWNANSIRDAFTWAIAGTPRADWYNLLPLDPKNPYANEAFRWSPAAAWLWAGAIVPLGLLVWRLAHLVALSVLGDWRLIVAVALTFPFWWDTLNGNVLTFVLVTAWLALQGNRAGVIAYCVLAALVPRPLMVPVLVYLLWTRRDARIVFALSVAAVLLHAAAVGELGDWIGRLTSGGSELASVYNTGPSHYIGTLWIPIGIGLAFLAARYGWFGVASVAFSPYLFHYYLLMLVLDLRPGGPGRRWVRQLAFQRLGSAAAPISVPPTPV